MATANDHRPKSEMENESEDNSYWGPCKYCPLSRRGCPMARFLKNTFQR